MAKRKLKQKLSPKWLFTAVIILIVLLFLYSNHLKQTTTKSSDYSSYDDVSTWKTFQTKKYSLKYPYDKYTVILDYWAGPYSNDKGMDYNLSSGYLNLDIVTSSSNYMINYNSYPFCSDKNTIESICVINDGSFGQKQPIKKILLGGKSAISYYIENTDYSLNLHHTTHKEPRHVVRTTSQPLLEIRVIIQEPTDHTKPNIDNIFNKILATFMFSDSKGWVYNPPCLPRPECLDTSPKCQIAQTANMCPPTVTPSQ